MTGSARVFDEGSRAGHSRRCDLERIRQSAPRRRTRGGLSAEVRQAYANLEIEPPSSLEEAKAAWRGLMRKYHPDRHQQDPKKTEIATKVAARLTEAYRIVREHLGDD